MKHYYMKALKSRYTLDFFRQIEYDEKDVFQRRMKNE